MYRIEEEGKKHFKNINIYKSLEYFYIMCLFSRIKHEVYCQNCGANLTEIGGNVANNGRIYCHGYGGDMILRCVEAALINDPQLKFIIADYHNPIRVQKDIRKK